jgi:putative ABC transport system substrate-binding protein
MSSYGRGYADNWRRTAEYADKILKGAKPGALPLQQHTVLEKALDLKPAKAAGITIPPSVLPRADAVIE